MEKTASDNNTGFISLYDKSKRYVDVVYLLGLIIYMAYMAMDYTSMTLYKVTQTLKLYGTVLIILVAVFRVFFVLFKNLKKAILAIVFVAFCYACSVFSPDCEMLPITALAMVGAIDVSADKILTAGIIGNIVMILNNIYFSLVLGNSSLQIRDFFYLGKDSFYVSKMNNFSSTDFAAHYLWIIAAYLWIRGKKLTWGEWAAILLFDFALYSLTGSNTTFLCVGLALIFALIMKVRIIYHNKNSDACPSNSGISSLFSRSKKAVKFCFKYSFIILAVICIALTALFDHTNSFFQLLNRVTNQRFGLGHRALIEYGVHLFSSNVPSYGINASADGFYNFIDCSYMNILIRYGIILLIFYVAAMTYIQVKHKKFFYGACIIAVCALSCIEEHHLVELPYNFFLLILFSEFNVDKKTENKIINQKPKISIVINAVSYVLCALFFAAFIYNTVPKYKAIKELDRLDKRANDLFVQIQSDVNVSISSGQWNQVVLSMNSYEYGDVLSKPSDFSAVTGSRWSDVENNPKMHSFYSVKYDPALINEKNYAVLDLILSDEAKEMIGDGSVVIEYDVITGKLYSIWFAESSGCYAISGGRNTDRVERLRENVIPEGYYAGY